MRQRFTAVIFILALIAGLAMPMAAQSGPPPEIRTFIKTLVESFNSGKPEQWEKMAQEYYSPELLKKRTVDERRQMYERMRGEMGTVSVGKVLREGPDEPLQIFLKSSTGAELVWKVDLESEAPVRLRGMAVEVGGGKGERKSGATPPPVNGGMSNDELAAALDSYFREQAAKEVFSGVVLVAKDGRPVFEKAYGYADRANQVPNSVTTRFNLGSINKTFTHLAIQQLIDQGKLSLTDTLGKLIPDYPQETSRAATVAQLLGHSGGIADFFGDEFTRTSKDRFRSNADYFKLVSGEKPLFAPGARNQYCNGCYIVLGAIIERVAGIPYEKYVEENIFKPAGMSSTGALQADAVLPQVAHGYTRRGGDSQLRSNIYMHGASGSAAGGGYSTAEDLLAFSQATQQGKLKDTEGAGGFGIAGGAPGINSLLARQGPWTVIVLTNFDPPTGEEIGMALTRALAR